VTLCRDFSAEMTERMKTFWISDFSTAPNEYIPIALSKYKLFDLSFL
jgi:hypothetical protein